MADPLSISVSVLAVVTAAIKSTKSLSATVGRYKDRDKILNRLQHALEDLINVLSSLEGVVASEAPILPILQGPVGRCSQVCREFEEAMKTFSGMSKTGFRDWAKMEFMRDDINGFMDTLASYKSTILVGLGTITMHHAKLNQKALEDYSEMIKDTAYDLKIRLHRIEEHMAASNTTSSDPSINLQDEREVTQQCLRICQDAESFLESLQGRQPSSRSGAAPQLAGIVQKQFEAELETNQILDESRRSFAQSITHFQQRLSSINSANGPERDRLVSQLQEDISVSRQCLEVCKEASQQVHYRKIHTIGEVIADDDTDQIVVTTLADLFDVGRVFAKNRGAQLVGSMSDETLQILSKDRYSSRFGAVTSNLSQTEAETSTSSTANNKNNNNNNNREKATRLPNPMVRDAAQQLHSETGRDRPLPNEVKKRSTEGRGV